jgi:OmpA-OmpF porin, OOP family
MNFHKHIVFFIFFAAMHYAGNTQNLVLNPSFEENYTLNYSIPYRIDTVIVGYYDPSSTTSDYHHTNAADNRFRVPNNLAGFQHAFDGLAYSGLIVYNESFVINTVGMVEYITGTLSTYILVQNKCYKVSFQYSLAESPSLCNIYAISNFGIYFSESIPTHINRELTHYQPQIEVNQWMGDTTNWVKITRYFLSEGNENYFTMGNFNEIEDTDTTFIKAGLSTRNCSYIYLDDIIIEEVPLQTPYPKLTLAQIRYSAKARNSFSIACCPTTPFTYGTTLLRAAIAPLP